MAQLYPHNPNVSQRIQGTPAAGVEPLDQAFNAQFSKACKATDADWCIGEQLLANGSTTNVTWVTGQDEVQSLDLGGATALGYTLGYNGQTTASILFSANALAIQAALILLSNIGPTDVVVTGTGPFAITFGGDLANQGQPLLVVTDSTTGGTGVVATRTTHGHGQPDVARAVVIVANTGGVTGNVVVTGKDLANATITDTIALNGTTPVAGVKAFKSITSVLFPARTHALDTVNIGLTEVLGLHHKLSHNTVLRTTLNNVVEGTAPTVTVSATVLSQNTIDLNSALVEGQTVDCYYLV